MISLTLFAAPQTYGLGAIAGIVTQAAITFGLAFGALELGLAAGKGKGIMGGAFSGSLDGLKKFRRNRAHSNVHALKTGERFHGSRFIPGSSRAAEFLNKAGFSAANGSMPFTGKTRAAFGQTGMSEARELMKSKDYEKIANHDDTLRYATYADERQGFRAVRDHARRRLEGDVAAGRMSAAQADAQAEQAARDARNDFKASGLKVGGATAMAAAMGMGRGGTAYRDMRDQVETIARAGGGNDTATRELAGDLNAFSKEKRPDLTPGNGELANMAMAVSHRGTGAVSQATYDQMTSHAWRNSGDVGSLARTVKGNAVNSINSVGETNSRMMHLRQVMNSGAPGADAAETELRGHYGGPVNMAAARTQAERDAIQAQINQEGQIGSEVAHTAAEFVGSNYAFGSSQNLDTMADLHISLNPGQVMAASTARAVAANGGQALAQPLTQQQANQMFRDSIAERRYVQTPP